MKTSKVLMAIAVIAVLASGNLTKAAELPKPQPTGFKVAVVDIAQIVQKSPQISALQTERQNKLNDLEAFVVNARKDVASQKTDDTKKILEDKYNKELNQRKEAIDKDFAKKLVDIDKEITLIIKNKAKKMGYNLTLVKGSVIDGGTDITSTIIKDLK